MSNIYLTYNGTEMNYILDAKSLIDDAEDYYKSNLKQGGSKRGYEIPIKRIKKSAWLIALTSDELNVGFQNYKGKIINHPIDVESENLKQPNYDYIIESEKEYKNFMKDIIYDLNKLYKIIYEEVKSRGITKNEEHRTGNYLNNKR